MTARALMIAAVAILLVGCASPGNKLQISPAGYRLDDSSVPTTPFMHTKWKAVLLAGDDSIGAFDNAVEEIDRLFRARHIEVVQRLSATQTKVSSEIGLSTAANLRSAVAALGAPPAQGCLVYATSHGTPQGLFFSKDRDHLLRPESLRTMMTEGCGDAPTVVVLSGCHTATFLREDTVAPNVIMLTAAAFDKKSFGCQAGARYTYYDGCFIQEFPRAMTWQQLHEAVSFCVYLAERSLRQQSSDPQAFFGRLMKNLPIGDVKP